MELLKKVVLLSVLLAAAYYGHEQFLSHAHARQQALHAMTATWPVVRTDAAPRLRVDEDPEQTEAGSLPVIDFNGYHLRALARYRIAARVLGREEYDSGRESDLSPTDLALGWGPMADPHVLAGIAISQSNRYFFWKTPEYPIPRRDIEVHASNVHLVPASTEIDRELKDVKVDEQVVLGGYLIEADADDGWRWISSLTREDTGPGACELLYVESVGRP